VGLRIGVVIAVAIAVWALLDFVVAPALEAHVSGPKPELDRMADRGAASDGATRPAARRPPAAAISPAVPKLSLSITHPLPERGTPLMSIYGDLKAMAAQGDANAACRIAFELNRCAKLPIFQSARVEWAHRLANEQDPARRAGLQRMRDHAEGEVAIGEKVCKDFPQEDLPLAWDYGLASALAGNRSAMFHVSFFPWGLDISHPEQTLEQWSQWRQLVPRIMQSGIDAGDPRMFSLASRAYVRPWFGTEVFPRDPVRALALELAIARRSAPEYAPTLERDIQYLIRTQSLQPDQVEAAKGIAATLPPLRGIPERGLDWSRGMAPEEDGSECEAP
jgi:hypothetical protein